MYCPICNFPVSYQPDGFKCPQCGENHKHYYFIGQHVVGGTPDHYVREGFAWCRCGHHIAKKELERILNNRAIG